MTRSTHKSSFTQPTSSIDMIYKLDANGCYTYVNSVAAEVLHKDPEELIGQSFLPFVREDYQKKVLSFYKEQQEKRVASTYFEFPLKLINNRQVWIGQTVDFVFKKGRLTEVVAVAHDISEKVLATQFAANSEEKYRNIINNIHLGLIEVDLEDNVVFVNHSFCEMMGYRPDELIGKNASEVFVDPEDGKYRKRIALANERRKAGESSAYEVKIRKKDGSPVWMIVSGAPVRNSKGDIIGSIGIHNDISSRKKEELHRLELLKQLSDRNKELHEKQNFLATINRFAERLIRSQGIGEIIKEITENLMTQFGFSHCDVYLLNQESMMLRKASNFGVKNQDGDGLKEEEIRVGEGVIGSVAQTSKAEIVDDTTKDKRCISGPDGSCSELSVPIMADGQLIGVIHSRHDAPHFFTDDHLQTFTTIATLAATKIKGAIIAQKREEAELALKDSETRLRSVVNSSLDAIITIDEAGMVTDWNHQATDLFGYSRSETMGKDLSALIVPEKYRQAHRQGMKHFLKTGEGPVLNRRIEVHGQHRDGSYFPIELSILPVRMNKSYLFTAFVRDITLRKKAVDDMEQALQKQKELNELKSRLIAMTSHEFRTPLTTIQSSMDLISFLLEKENIGSKDKVEKNFERITFELSRLNNMVNNILMTGKIEAGQLSFHPEPTDIMELCQKVVHQSFSHQRDGRTVDISVSGKPFPVNIDRNIYIHIITNLLSNAFKYSENRGNPQLGITYTDTEMQLKVKDTGIGIPEEDQARLFESFFRAGNSGAIKGNGMGLAIVKQFVELHNATISVESQLNKGTNFTIIHPREDMAEAKNSTKEIHGNL